MKTSMSKHRNHKIALFHLAQAITIMGTCPTFTVVATQNEVYLTSFAPRNMFGTDEQKNTEKRIDKQSWP